jgi:hypothetical protein
MKKIAILAVAMVMMAGLAGSAFAANSLAQGSKALSIGFGDSVLNHVASPTDQNQNNPIVDVSAKFVIAKDMAITAGLGFQMNTGDLEGTYLSFNVGMRKYFKTDDFAPFVGAQLSYITYDAELPPANGGQYVDFSAWDVAGVVGAEYFFSKQFSIEGSVGLAIGTAEDNQSNLDTTYIGTRNMGVRANFYF